MISLLLSHPYLIAFSVAYLSLSLYFLHRMWYMRKRIKEADPEFLKKYEFIMPDIQKWSLDITFLGSALYRNDITYAHSIFTLDTHCIHLCDLH